MNGFLAQNLEWLDQKCPGHDRALAAARLAAVRWPVSARPNVCEVTVNSACGSACLFCYIPPGGHAAAEPSFASVCRALYEGRRSGAWVAAIIGGEPTLRADLPKIASFARKAGYQCVKLCTNGHALADRARVAALRRAGVNMFDISLHGRTAEIHDAMVGRSGSYALVRRAMDNVKAAGAELGTNQVLTRLNSADFARFFRFALLELGINYFNIIYANYRGMMARNAGRLKVPVSLCVPQVRAAMGEFARNRLVPLSGLLVNFQPCLLPGFTGLMSDWRVAAETAPETLLLPDGSAGNMHQMKDSQKRRPRSCRGCALEKSCRGVDREYLALYGGGEFKPLKRRPAGPLPAYLL